MESQDSRVQRILELYARASKAEGGELKAAVDEIRELIGGAGDDMEKISSSG